MVALDPMGDNKGTEFDNHENSFLIKKKKS